VTHTNFVFNLLAQRRTLRYLQITRSLPDKQGGYAWTIMFLEKDGLDVPPLVGISSELVGAGDGSTAGVTVVTTSTPMREMKGGGYIWTRDIGALEHAIPLTKETARDEHAVWHEQAILFSQAYQESDLFGLSGLALSGR
jgi:hypothetical protein